MVNRIEAGAGTGGSAGFFSQPMPRLRGPVITGTWKQANQSSVALVCGVENVKRHGDRLKALNKWKLSQPCA